SETWPKDPDALLHGGGMTWMTGTYDPELNLLYWGTGNPNPVLVGEGRPGDNLYTCSIVALNPDTGTLAWYFQPSPHDVHDSDGALVEPGSDGSTNWMAPSFDPQTGLFYVNARRVFSIYYRTATGKAEGWGGRDRNLWANATLRALDYRTGKVVWNHEVGNGESIAGILTT